MPRNHQRSPTTSRIGTTMKQTRSDPQSNGPLHTSKIHDILRESDVSHQQKQKFNPPNTAQQNIKNGHVANGGGTASGIDGSDDDGEDASAEADAEEDDKEPIAIAPSEDPSMTEDQTTGLTTPTKKSRREQTAKRGSSRKAKHRATKKSAVGTAGDSDEDDYDGVDLISDSDEEEPEVEELEEKMIIDSEEENEAGAISPLVPMGPPSTPSISSVGWEGFDLDDGVFLSDVPFFDEQISRNDPNLFNEIAIYNTVSSFDGLDRQGLEQEPATSPTTPRRVRFEEEVRQYSDSTSTDGSDEDEDGFPDLFMQQDSLDPNFRLMIENDNDEDDGHSLTDGESSYWDLKDQEELELEKHGLKADANSSSCGSSSGYESGSTDSPANLCDHALLTLPSSFKPTRVTRPMKISHLLLPLRDPGVSFEELRRLHSVPRAMKTLRHPCERLPSHHLEGTDLRWARGLLIRTNQLPSSTVQENEWSSILRATRPNGTQISLVKPALTVALPQLALVHLSLV